MSLVTCPECKHEHSSTAKACPSCGYRKPRRIFRKLVIGVGAVFGALMFIGWISDSPQGNAKTRDRLGIEDCWEKQQRKSLSPADQRFMAGVCEKMEADFQDRWKTRP